MPDKSPASTKYRIAPVSAPRTRHSSDAMNNTVQTASDDCVDAYTVLNENAPASSAASAAGRCPTAGRTRRKSINGIEALSITCTSSGTHSRSPAMR